MIQSGKKILLFPVETTVRELDFRLILAVLCARPDWQIIIGDHEELFKLALRLKNVVQVLKNVTDGKRPWKYERFKKLGHRIIQLDEEGAIYPGEKDVWRALLDKRLDVLQLNGQDYVCTWGQFQADHYRSYEPACAENIIATGHPRLDLGSPRYRELFKEEADRLQAKYGNFILINTNIASNRAAGSDALMRFHKVRPDDVERRTHFIEQYSYEAQREGLFIELINRLSNSFPETSIVLRPHPSEDIRSYKALLSYVPRVEVTREGSLHSWLLATRVLIHGGCTTAIEAYLCGTPIVNYHPLPDPRFEVALPNLLGVSCKTADEVVNAVQTCFAGGELPIPAMENLSAIQEMLSNFRGDTDSFELLSDIIGKCLDEAAPTEFIGGPPTLLGRRIKETMRRFACSTPGLRWLAHSRGRGTDKFPPFIRKEIMHKLEIVQKITGTPVKVAFHSSKVLSITTT